MTAFSKREVIKILEKLGFYKARQTGSHLIICRSSDNIIIPVPIHAKDIKKGLMKGIIKQAKTEEEEFIKLK